MVWTGVAVAVTGVALAKLAFHEANSTYCPGSTVSGCTGFGCPPRICLRPHSDLRYDACVGRSSLYVPSNRPAIQTLYIAAASLGSMRP